MNIAQKPTWSADHSAELYRIREWGAGYFDLSEDGEVIITAPFESGGASVKLSEILTGIRERGYDTPLQLRIENILDDRIAMINNTFAEAIANCDYQAKYRGVFPIKVNQQSHVVEHIAQFGEGFNHGLEAGSKPELMVALALVRGSESLVICNGYKDSEFVDLGLRATQIGMNCFFVVENLEELPIIIERSRALGVKPLIGLRLKLQTQAQGHWEADSGERSIFGLSVIQMMEAVDRLRAEEMLDSVKMLHCHIGSQLPSLDSVNEGLKEACRYYSELVNEGAPLGWINIGGGLAVDYDGSKGTGNHTMNYSMEEYCRCVVDTVKEALDPVGVEHPMLVSESGRAAVAHSSVLLFNILDVSHFDPLSLPDELSEEAHPQIRALFEMASDITVDNLQASYDLVNGSRVLLRSLFAESVITLRELSLAENIYSGAMQRIARLTLELEEIPEGLQGLGEARADIYYGNFSLFQSLPDNWAVGQLFPVMPIHRLDERPTREAVVADITCDCDGRINRFIRAEGERGTLPLHDIERGDDYCLGVFLVGAYQETLGSLHNLFGDNNVVSIRINSDGSFDITHELHGDDVDEVLRYVEYEPKHLLRCFRNKAEKAVQTGKISAADRRQMLDAFSEGLRGYTYFEH